MIFLFFVQLSFDILLDEWFYAPFGTFIYLSIREIYLQSLQNKSV